MQPAADKPQLCTDIIDASWHAPGLPTYLMLVSVVEPAIDGISSGSVFVQVSLPIVAADSYLFS